MLQVFEPPDGGVAEHVLRLTLGLAQRGHHVEVAGPPASTVRRGLPKEIPYHVLPFERSYRSPGRDLASLRRLACHLRCDHPDLVHAHSAKAGVLGRIAARTAGLPCIYTPHCYPFIGDVSALRRRFAVGVERSLARWTARTVCVARAERDEAVRWGLAPLHALSVVYHGVQPCPDVEPDPDLLRLAGDGVLVGTVSVLRWQKGVDLFLDAAPRILARTPDARLVVIGEGPEAEAIRRRAERLGIRGRVTFLPFTPPSARALRALDLFVLPSRWEAFPIAVLEAMACGVATVASDVGGTGEALEDNAGRLVPSEDPEALATAIGDLVACPEARASLAGAGRDAVHRRFPLERMLAETEAVYREVRGSSESRIGSAP